jgi:hypothetical protein
MGQAIKKRDDVDLNVIVKFDYWYGGIF